MASASPKAASVARDAIENALDRLADLNHWSYLPGQANAAEPAAIASLALVAHGRSYDARRPANWLTQIQASDGSVGVFADQPEPCWTTALALLAWNACATASQHPTTQTPFELPSRRACEWAVMHQGRTAPQTPETGHDTTLVGWSWAADTHCWLEPTCYFVMALKAAGFSDHPRTREGVRLIANRLLDEGGANYGNTSVLGQQLLPHVQPTGLALLALANEPVNDPRVDRSLEWLVSQVGPNLPPVSLSYAILGLVAWKRQPKTSIQWIADALDDPRESYRSPHKQAHLLWAAGRVNQAPAAGP